MNEQAYNDLRDAIKKALSKEDVYLSELDLDYDRDMLGDYLTEDRNLWQALNALEDDRYNDEYKGKDRVERVEEEVVARCCESFLRDSKFVRQMAEQHYRSAREITRFLKQFAKDVSTVQIDAAVRAYEGGYDTNDISPENNLLRDYADIEKIADLWVKGLREIADKRAKAKKATGEIKASISDTFIRDYDQWVADGRPTKTIDVGTTSDILVSLGAKKQALKMNSDDIMHALKHDGMSDNVVRQIPSIMENPIAILKSLKVSPKNNNEASRLVMYGEIKDEHKAPVLAIVELRERAKGGRIIDVQLIKNVYGKDHNAADQFMRSEVMYLDENKNRTTNWLQSLGLRLPTDTTNLGSIGSIQYIDNFVKLSGVKGSDIFESSETKASISDREYLSLARKYESGDKSVEAELRKAVDDAARAAGAATLTNGKVKKYYHGTRADFTIFDIDKARRGTYGYGFYVTAIKDVASHYVPTNGRLLPLYLMTDNLATRDDHRITEEMVSEIVQAYDIPGDLFHEQTISQLVANESDAEIIRRLANYIDDETTVKPSVYLNAFREVFGYDGLRMPGENIVWSNDLLKSAELITYDNDGNIIPLSERFNEKEEDIRHSIMDKDFRMTKRGNVRTFEQNGTTANLIGSSVELQGGSLLNRVRMLQNLAEEYGSVRVDAASEKEAEAFKRAGAEQVEEGLEGRGAEYGTWEFKYQRQPGQDIYDPKQKVKFAKDIVKYKMPGIAA